MHITIHDLSNETYFSLRLPVTTEFLDKSFTNISYRIVSDFFKSSTDIYELNDWLAVNNDNGDLLYALLSKWSWDEIKYNRWINVIIDTEQSIADLVLCLYYHTNFDFGFIYTNTMRKYIDWNKLYDKAISEGWYKIQYRNCIYMVKPTAI